MAAHGLGRSIADCAGPRQREREKRRRHDGHDTWLVRLRTTGGRHDRSTGYDIEHTSLGSVDRAGVMGEYMSDDEKTCPSHLTLCENCMHHWRHFNGVIKTCPDGRSGTGE